MCTGALLLAEAGLFDGRRATTHWAACADLASRFPRVTVEPDAQRHPEVPYTTWEDFLAAGGWDD
ncbi:hypothetical protein GCM10022224_009380 [Nonomuraea antimicrobica]|uniref:DJ-1/PfpI family protein n=1 Tax=Nonomuraea antimicrobica TaxID=561173 RepID=A0ABP7B5A7_9ACTN